MNLRARKIYSFRAIMYAATGLMLLVITLGAETLPLKSYTTSDGLAHDRVNRIVRDSRGFLWFCTSEGLSRFDGYEFKNYTEDDGLPHRTVMDFLETRAGELWIATSNGLVFFDPRGLPGRALDESQGDDAGRPSMFNVIRPAAMKSPQRMWMVRDVIEDRNGTLWIATSDGLYKFDRPGESQPQRFDLPAAAENKNEDFYHVLEDRTGGIWAATEYGLYRVSADRSNIQTINVKMRAGSFLEDREGNVWVGSVGGGDDEIGLHLYTVTENEATRFQTFRKRHGLVEETWLNSLIQTSDGRVIVGIGGGLCEYTPQSDASLPQFRILSNQDVVELAKAQVLRTESAIRNLARRETCGS